MTRLKEKTLNIRTPGDQRNTTNKTGEFYIGLDQNGVWTMFRAPDSPKQEDIGHQFLSVRGPYETERRALYGIIYANVDKNPFTLW